MEIQLPIDMEQAQQLYAGDTLLVFCFRLTIFGSFSAGRNHFAPFALFGIVSHVPGISLPAIDIFYLSSYSRICVEIAFVLRPSLLETYLNSLNAKRKIFTIAVRDPFYRWFSPS
jgi:hypothetical protein